MEQECLLPCSQEPTPGLIAGQTNPVYVITCLLGSILKSISHVRLDFLVCLLVFPIKVLFTFHVCCASYAIIVLYMMLLMKYSAEWPKIKMQFKNAYRFYAGRALENELIHKSDQTFKSLFIYALCCFHGWWVTSLLNASSSNA
jgi:hypothetical protein